MLDILLNLDYWLLNLVNTALTQPGLDVFFFWLTDLHKTTYFKIIALPLMAFLFIKKFKREGVSLFLMMLLSLALCDFIGGKIKNIVARDRPEFNQSLTVTKRSEAGSFSFYSNHAANMFTFATYTSQFIPILKVPLYTLATLVSYSRVYNGVHYPSDVVAGSGFGYLWGLLFSYMSRKLQIYINSRKKSE